ncbi:nucleoside-diphosphate sugar epimerase [Paenibacillus sp. MMS18-CY102]|uniref:nucleoside-diphosphate sugar epimerase n=1 Tax=Paenibacillus sp. MMS18-CY102 TaxID=2682849 RepID=UPI001923B32A|nr:nucleoside-diphosphate sugar epimerase [Paenibacillus sp. MMS18-CY102]
MDGVDDEGIPFRDIASMIGKHLNVPAVSITHEEAGTHFGFLGLLADLDIPRSGVHTGVIGMKPVHSALLADLAQGHYFNK